MKETVQKEQYIMIEYCGKTYRGKIRSLKFARNYNKISSDHEACRFELLEEPKKQANRIFTDEQFTDKN